MHHNPTDPVTSGDDAIVDSAATPSPVSAMASCELCAHPNPPGLRLCEQCGARLTLEERIPPPSPRTRQGVQVAGALFGLVGLGVVVWLIVANTQTARSQPPTTTSTVAVSSTATRVGTTIALLEAEAATASSETDEDHASHLIDGDLGSPWVGAAGDDVVLEFAFDKPVILKAIEFHSLQADTSDLDAVRIRKFELSFDSDSTPLAFELDGGSGPQRVSLAGVVTSGVTVRVLSTYGPRNRPETTLPLAVTEVRFFGVR